MTRFLAPLALAAGMVVAGQAYAQVGTPIFQQNFDGLTLGPSVNERLGTEWRKTTTAASVPGTRVWHSPTDQTAAFTHTGPAGWTIDNNFNNFGNVDLNNPNYAYGNIVGNIGLPNVGDPLNGVDEWEGWSFANKEFWIAADDQQRSQFALASGNVLVADNDEYDDLGSRNGQYYNMGVTTSNINVAGKTNITFEFDSSWRDEAADDAHANPVLGGNVNNQTAVIWASFDGGAPVKVTQWHSDGAGVLGDTTGFKDDSVNETLSFPISVPAGATNMKITLGQINAGNDWWWAVDNLEVKQGATTFWSENFDAVPLGESVNERQTRHLVTQSSTPDTTAYPNAFTHTPPVGWSVDNSGFADPGMIGDNDYGVFEWEGWSFSTKEFSAAASNSQLLNFTKSTGNYAIADSDAFGPLDGTLGEMVTVLKTPSIDLTGIAAGALKLQFDSAWQTSGAQAAEITVNYGSGDVQVLRWESNDDNGLLHATNLNETVFVNLNNPAGATSAVVSFKYNGTDNWFWALDNLKIGTAAAPANADFDGDGDVDGQDFLTWQKGFGTGTTLAQGDANGDSVVNAADLTIWKSQFGLPPAVAAAGAVPEPAACCLAAIALAAATFARRSRNN